MEIWHRTELLELLQYRSDLSLEEMQDFLFEAFEIQISRSAISRQLNSAGWTNKKSKIIAAQRSDELRYEYLYRIRRYRPDQLVFVDESGVNKDTGIRRTGWAPKGLAAFRTAEIDRFQNSRVQILPALTLSGILHLTTYYGTTDGDGFFRWLQECLIPKCGRFPEPNSVIVMDNLSCHRIPEIEGLCRVSGVHLEFLPPYSPDFNPIEEYFGDLKRYIRKTYSKWNNDENDTRDFMEYLRDCAMEIGYRLPQIEGHFRHSFVNFDGTEHIFDDIEL
ncbi:hypothetical protein CGCS363_v001173 [Colletotrichum siamense]|uniref:uncharacterized protein n=1 Tax=Colletotrichum siamense TaxID=690259 RepID=UPI001872B0C6|nr:uncharacterized protein CGCS363_v015182 [Colletotrichum siamense]XP_036487865.1 uncharacterized protein CGCS363_v015060 [Colletotrichum siamense]XP_036487889.1 uncharacterized protein CGCS363_v015046 [Colletotrichum siamense]XP_036488582.1 uncharacterized protein CGCS363_v014197 [Colletotrichum siamense]XP_036488766.1 uncharacterized protein CGCS363_v014491 [Colletotrichum siamense]XP_036488984.1 uncharacterized protein CGCS363_v014860 [Colletotrichum siamense]XP_036489077.1 uncharacterize